MASMFAFRMRAYAAAHFNYEERLTLTWPDAEATLQSEYTGGEDGCAYPVTIHGEIRGEAASVDDAQTRLAGSIGNTLPLLALASNAAIADPLAVAVHGVDLATPQTFLAYRTPLATDWFPPGKRRLDVEATRALATAVGHHPQTALLHRAIESYRRALGHWFPEELLLAGEFLFITAETLSRFMLESRAHERGITPKNLVRLSGLGTEAQLRWRYLREEVFHDDAAALEALKEASDGFEHGYMAVADIRGRQEPVLERAFGCLRRALVRAAGVADAMSDRLLGDVYDVPRSLVPAVTVVTGEVARIDENQPVPDLPIGGIELAWHVPAPLASRRADGEVEITLQPEVKVVALPENTKLSLSGFGMRVAHVLPTAELADVELRDGRPCGSVGPAQTEG